MAAKIENEVKRRTRDQVQFRSKFKHEKFVNSKGKKFII